MYPHVFPREETSCSNICFARVCQYLGALCAVFLSMLLIAPFAWSQADDAGAPVKWPSGAGESLQSVVDAIADGGTIKIAAGVHLLEDPVILEGKKVSFEGAGTKSDKPKKFTHLVGPPPHPVADEEGNIILPAEDAVGLLTCLGGEIEVRNLVISGFDVGVLIKDDIVGNPSTGTVENCLVNETGRGVMSLSYGLLTVKDTEIADTNWNAISVAPNFEGAIFAPGIGFSGGSVKLVNPGGAGIYLNHTIATINAAVVLNATAGGIVGFETKAVITNSFLIGNGEAGILLVDANVFPFFLNVIQNNFIANSVPFAGILGDGVSMWNSNGDVIHNNIFNNSRAGVSNFGSVVRLFENKIGCSTFDVQASESGGVPAVNDDLGGNLCGCGGPLVPCVGVGGPPQAPPMVGGLE